MKVSVGLFCKNSISSIKNWLFGIKSQTRKPDRVFAFDCNSSDGTYEFLKTNGITVISEQDNSPQEAFFKMLKHNQEDIFICSLSDEELFPCAIAEAENFFRYNPNTDILTRDIETINVLTNKIEPAKGRPFDLNTYMKAEYSPHFAASFFKRTAFEKINLWNFSWQMENIGEYEFWFRAGKRCSVRYEPGLVSKYFIGLGGQLSTSSEKVLDCLLKRTRFLKYLENMSEITKTQKYIFISCLLKNTLGYVLGLLKNQHLSLNAQKTAQQLFSENLVYFNLKSFKYFYRLMRKA